jgi:hypothetical protein
MTDITGYPDRGWPLAEAALWYAAQGWPVFPLHHVVSIDGTEYDACTCKAGGNPGCLDKGKHPRTIHGFKDATTNASIVRGWWEVWPDANIGIATGYPFAFVVDEDVPGALHMAYPVLLDDRDMVEQATPNGRHLLFSAASNRLDPELPELGNSTGGRGRSLGPGIDTRGRGGYIVACPSVTPSGRYVWRSDPRGPWPMLPAPMEEALRPKALKPMGELYNYSSSDDRISRYVESAVEAAASELRSAAQGNRNHTLNEVAFRLGTIGAHGALPSSTASAALVAAWSDLFPEGLTPDGRASFGKTFNSGWASGLERPREPWPPATAGAGLGFVPAGWTPGAAGPVLLAADTEPGAVAGPVPLVWGEFLDRDMTKAEWVAGDLFEAGQQVALVGAGKAGKSLLALEWAQHIAAGRPYLGAVGRPPRRVGYLDHENSQRDIQQRALAFGFSAEDLSGLSYYSFPVLPPLDSRAGGRALLALVIDGGIECLFLDTVSRMIEGPENESDTWLNLYRYSLMPLKALGIATVRLDHFGKDHDRGARGSSAKTQDVDHVWTLTKNEGGSLVLNRTHSRTGLGREELQLIRHGEQTEDGWTPGATRHVVSDIAFKPAEWLWRIEAGKRLDEAGVPAGAGVPTVRASLARIGIKAGTTRLEDLVRWRKAGGNDSSS